MFLTNQITFLFKVPSNVQYNSLLIRSKFTSSGIVQRHHLIVQLHHRTVQALHNIRHLHRHTHQVLRQVPAITNIHRRHPLLLSVQHIPLPVQCIHLRVLHILHLLYNTHPMLVRSTINRTVLAPQFIHLPTSLRQQVQGKRTNLSIVYFINNLSV